MSITNFMLTQISFTIIILTLLLQPDGCLCQTCDRQSNETQCGPGQICINSTCSKAITCPYRNGYDCGTVGYPPEIDPCSCYGVDDYNGVDYYSADYYDYKFTSLQDYKFCRSGYCQKWSCEYTGECAYGQVCHMITVRNDIGGEYQEGYCADYIEYIGQEGDNFTFHFIEPAIPGDYTAIYWKKIYDGKLSKRNAWNIAKYKKAYRYYPIYARGFCDSCSRKYW